MNKPIQNSTDTQARRPEAGFTLIEVLVAVSILSIISSFVFGVLISSLNASEEAEWRMDINHTGRYLINRMTNDLTSATIMANSKRGGLIGKHFTRNGKDRDEIHFTSFSRLYLSNLPKVNQSEIGYYFLIGDEGAEMLLRRESDVIEKPLDRGGVAMEVTDMIKEIRIRYYTGTSWEEQWDSDGRGKTLPRAVSIELTLSDGERDYFFSNIVRIPDYA